MAHISKRFLIISLAGFAAVGFFFVTASSASAATYYVATNGNDSNSGTESQPFRTLQRAANRVGPGDTVLVRAGRYAGFRKDGLQGIASAWITFKNYPGEHVVLDQDLRGAGVDSPGNGAIIYFVRNAYMIFDGFEVTNTNPIIS